MESEQGEYGTQILFRHPDGTDDLTMGLADLKKIGRTPEQDMAYRISLRTGWIEDFLDKQKEKLR